MRYRLPRSVPYIPSFLFSLPPTSTSSFIPSSLITTSSNQQLFHQTKHSSLTPPINQSINQSISRDQPSRILINNHLVIIQAIPLQEADMADAAPAPLSKVDSAVQGLSSSPPKAEPKRRASSSVPGVFRIEDLGMSALSSVPCLLHSLPSLKLWFEMN